MLLGAGLPWAVALAGCTTSPRADHSAGASSGAAGLDGSTPTGSDGGDRPLIETVGNVRIQVDGLAPVAQRRHYVAAAVDAVVPVDRVWGSGSLPRRVRLTATSTAAEFAQLAGTVGADVPAVTRSDARVILHPDLWTRTTAAGRQVVVTHELTHVALGQGSWTHAPRWTVEGPAEVTAYHRSSLPPERIAPSLARRVRTGRAPDGPPSAREMAGADGYGLAWAWCRYLVARSGEPTFVRFVRRVGRNPTEAGARAAFHAAYATDIPHVATGYSTWLASWL